MGLRELLGRQVPTTSVGRDGFFDVEDSFCTPGFWSAYAARALQRGVHTGELGLSGKLKGYAHAIGIERALGEADSFPHDRRRAGQTYSPLVLLDTPELTEKATGEINGCIRGLFPEQEYAAFVASICELVGDLLDNVWSHGKSTGFSMAQRWGKDREGFFFEFAIADCGLGFLRELRRVNSWNRWSPGRHCLVYPEGELDEEEGGQCLGSAPPPGCHGKPHAGPWDDRRNR